MSNRTAPTRLVASALCILTSALVGTADAQPQAAVADPAFEYLVEGRAILANGQPAAGVDVMRTENANGLARSDPNMSTVTDAQGVFRFADHGLGFGPGHIWYLAFRPARCPVTVETISLRRDDPGGRQARDLSTGTVVKLPVCSPNASIPKTALTATMPHTDGDTFVLSAVSSAREIDACFGGRVERNRVATLQFRVVIDTQGRVVRATIITAPPRIDVRVKGCYEGVIRAWRFPPGRAREFDTMYGHPTEPQ